VDNETVHIKLKFNDMVMSVCDHRQQCHRAAKFWLPWENWPNIDAYCKMNNIKQIGNKRALGNLVAGRIIHLL